MATDTLSPKLQAMLARAQRAALDAVLAEAERVFAASQDLVPVDTGALRDSGGIGSAQVEGTTAMATIRYGGGNSGVDYAAFVHEGHRTRGGGFVPPQPFLLQPLLQSQEGFAARVGADFWQRLGSGSG